MKWNGRKVHGPSLACLEGAKACVCVGSHENKYTPGKDTEKDNGMIMVMKKILHGKDTPYKRVFLLY